MNGAVIVVVVVEVVMVCVCVCALLICWLGINYLFLEFSWVRLNILGWKVPSSSIYTFRSLSVLFFPFYHLLMFSYVS